MSSPHRVDAVVIGSGAGGSVTALELAAHGLDVLVLEEGGHFDRESFSPDASEAMRRLYRRRGMTPIAGPVGIGFVEGCCVGGSTEINSGFWHRPSREILLRWEAQYGIEECSEDDLLPHLEIAENLLGVGMSGSPLPRSTALFGRGIKAMGWLGQEVPRTAPGCRGSNLCAAGCPTNAKKGMRLSLLPMALRAGARLVTHCRAQLLLRRGDRIQGVLAVLRRPGRGPEALRIDADNVFVCAGPMETPALLRRSGIRRNTGASLRIHPMLKATALFDEEVNAHESVLPLFQVKEFWPEISMGGAFFTPGHLAVMLSENWPQSGQEMENVQSMASYYVATRGTGWGSVRASPFMDGEAVPRYRLSSADIRHLSMGLGRLASLLLAAGARAVFPSVFGLPEIRTERDAVRWLDEDLPPRSLGLTTVHAFSSCPMGERRDRCAADSFGRVYDYDNLYLNDASIVPDSPGVNPQGTIMALARRNVLRFLGEL
jgi:choline dehydrogenase-like flavoprotein